MKNKLLLSSALVGSLVISGAAIAQTTITGDANLSYRSNSNKGTVSKDINDSGFGRETQINIQNKGSLPLAGLSYAAGFSLEFDGQTQGHTTAASATDGVRISNENVFIDIISGNTTFSVGSDHLPNMSYSAVPRVAQHMGTTLNQAQLTHTAQPTGTGVDAGTSYQFYPGTNMGASKGMGIGVMQKTAIGTLVGQYFPQADAVAGANDSTIRQDTTWGYEVTFRGDLGVKGLTAYVGRNFAEKNASLSDAKGTAYGLAYNFGQFSIGAGETKTENGKAAVSDATNKIDIKSREYGATYAVTKDITVGYNRVETTGVHGDGTTLGISNASMTNKETAEAVTLGYNLGPITTSLTWAQLRDARGVSGNDTDIALVRAGVKF
jgi:hypothetical protein